jgi:hypothetical protein
VDVEGERRAGFGALADIDLHVAHLEGVGVHDDAGSVAYRLLAFEPIEISLLSRTHGR